MDKEDERTPGQFWVEHRDGRWQVQTAHRGPGSSFCVAQINHWADDARALAEQIVKSLNAYGSTDALREALASIPDEAIEALTHKRQIDEDGEFVGVSHQAVDVIYAALKQARAALSGSPAPDNDLPNRVRVHVERLANTVMQLPLDEWSEISNDILRCADAMATGRPSISGSPAPLEGLREWQPIETAPRDGTEILLWSSVGDRSKAGPTGGHWSTEAECREYIGDCGGECRCPEYEYHDPYWFSWDGGFTAEHPPTHWMPLPPAPDAARTALAGVTAPTTGGTE